jgi:hypothetical protein
MMALPLDVVINRSPMWTLRHLDRVLHSWHALLRPGGRLICIHGLSTMKRSEATSFH